jgi:hypothetical protein
MCVEDMTSCVSNYSCMALYLIELNAPMLFANCAKHSRSPQAAHQYKLHNLPLCSLTLLQFARNKEIHQQKMRNLEVLEHGAHAGESGGGGH